MEKKGLSEIITTLVFILLGLVAVGIVWVVVANTISRGSEEVELGRFTVEMKIENVVVNSNSIDVTLTRGAGKGSVEGIKVVISDGVNSQSSDVDLVINEYEKRTVNIPYSGFVKSVSIIPILKTSSGSESTTGSVADVFQVSGEATIENSPNLVSWYRFEGNANDEIDGNDGVLSGPTLTSGKFGQAYYFDGVNDFAGINDANSLEPSSSITILAWIKKSSSTSGTVISKWVSANYAYELNVNNLNQINFLISSDGSNSATLTSVNTIPLNSWHHVIASWNGATMKTYIDGIEDTNIQQWSAGLYNGAAPVSIGRRSPAANFFNGTIDEVMIFNESLTNEEIQALYNLDLD